MTSTLIGASFALLFAVSASAQTPAPVVPSVPVAADAVPAETVSIVMTTSEGPITLALEKTRAPLTTANFLRYVDQKRLDGVTFYRAMNLGQGTGLIQGGPQNDPKRILKPVAHEPTSKPGLLLTDGTISLARLAPGTGRADVFITVGAIPFLDAHPEKPGDNTGFAAFGHVVQGMDIVRGILAAPTSPTKGEGVMKGQMIAAPIRILTARRTSPATR